LRRIIPALLFLTLPCVSALAGEPAREVPSEHWSLRPRSRPAVPQFRAPADRTWVRTPVDAFLLARLRQEGLRPAPEADRRVLIRRLTFDLLGLPPTPEEVEAFVQDRSPDAYERLVDRLLASPHYGERFGRHWLDVVRFAETDGFEYDRYRPGAWRYRDYVIAALNADKPYDQFVREQLAGDEEAAATGDQTLQIAAGFHRLGPVRRNAGNPEVAFSRHEVLAEQTDAIGLIFLGLTVGCARCHDHKFDDFSQTDYYRLQAFLAANQETDVFLASPRQQAEWKARTAKVQAEIKSLKESLRTLDGDARRRMEERLHRAERELPPPLPAISTVHNDPARATPIHVLKRGNPDRPGKTVGMGIPAALQTTPAPELPTNTARPRTALARWIASPDNPLTARVMVNRVWQYHFGQGLVATPNDFGVNGSAPSHPELLDWLANEFVAGGWRLKPIHRLLVLSSAYRQAAASPDTRRGSHKDPEDRLLCHFPRRRLDAGEVRDAMLAVAGGLNLRAGGPSVVVPVEADLVHLLYDPAQWSVTPDPREHDRRSVYLLAKRNLRLPFAVAFDEPDAQTSCARREQCTHPLQALELLNGRLSNRLAEDFAGRLLREAGDDPERQVERAFRLATGRPPSPRERDVSLAFLKRRPDGGLREFALAVFNLNAFLYVD
jgi:hypothetical protein